jgi:chlorobactene glucosyltransferase
VILPAKDEEYNIRKCLDSLLAKDYQNYEILVVMVNSFDKTSFIIYEIAHIRNNIIVVVDLMDKVVLPG